MEFRLLGVLEALDDGAPISLGGPKQRSVLAMLLLDANRAVSTERLVDGLWGDDPPTRAAATLHVYVSNLRKALEPDRGPRAAPSVLLTQAPGYLLSVDPLDVDLFRFEHLVAVARSLGADGCVAGAAVVFEEALAMWRGAPLADLTGEPFARFEVPRLDEARTGATEDRLDADLALGLDAELLPELDALVARHPYRERLHCQHMTALYRAGRQAEALAAYQSARDVLVGELGLEPGRELRETEAAILVQDPSLLPPVPPPITSTEVALVLGAITGTEPNPELIARVVDDGRESAVRAAAELRQAVEGRRARELTATLDAAGASQAELVRTRRMVADRVLDRRRRQPSRPSAPHGGAHNGRCPYRGLLRFEAEDAGWYFGRERLIADALASVASARCTGLVGASGSGKSSLTRAGLVAALRDDALPGSGRWPILLVTPGSDPLLELARALAPACHASSPAQVRDRLLDEPESLASFAARATDAPGRDVLVVVVDQLEEVFTVCRDAHLRDRYLDVLVQGAADPDAPVRVVTAIRADYYGRCADHAAFADLLGQASLLVGPMRPDELQRAVEAPARRAGLSLEDGLLDRIFDDVRAEPGALPLLETALLETWNRRDGDTLTVEGYVATGGVKGAVAQLADDVYERLEPSEREIAHGIFLRLAEPGEGTDDVRRRAPLEELVVDDEHARVLGALVDHRLVVTNDSNAEVAHEALLREWPRLREWLEEDRDGRRIRRALADATHDWEAAERDDDLVFRGSRLAAALDVEQAPGAELTPRERDFLAAGRSLQNAELSTARRTARRFRRLTAALGVLLVVALVAGGVAIQQGSDAQRSESAAETERRFRTASRLASQANALPGDRYALRLLLATEAHRLAPGPETEGALFGALNIEPAVVPPALTFDPPTSFGGGISRDGRLVAAAEPGGLVRVYDVATGTEIHRFDTHPDGEATLALLSPDAKWASVGTTKGTVSVWNVANGRRIAGPFDAGGDGPVYGLFDPTTRTRLFVHGRDGAVQAWDLVEESRPVGRVLARASPSVSSNEIPPLLFASGDGRRLLVGAADSFEAAFVLDASTGAVIAQLDGSPGALSSDGRFVALRPWNPNGSASVVVIDIASGDVVSAPIPTVIDAAAVMSFDASGDLLAVNDYTDANVHVVDWRAGSDAAEPIEFPGNTFPEFIPDGRLFLRNSSGAALVDVSTSRQGEPALPPIARRFTTGPGGGYAFTSDGQVITNSATNDAVVVSSPDDPDQREVRPVPPRVQGRNFVASPDQRHLVTLAEPGRVELVDRETGRVRGSFERASSLSYVGWNRTSSAAVLVFAGAEVYLWRMGHEQPRRISAAGPGGGQFVPGVELGWRPDGRELVLASLRTGLARTFDARTAHPRGAIEVGRDTNLRGGITYHPDGEHIAIATEVTPTNTASLVVVDRATGGVREEHSAEHILSGIAYYDGGRRFATLADATGDFDQQSTLLELRDANGFVPIASLQVPGIAFTVIASPGGTHVLLWHQDQTATVWDLRPRRWVAAACEVAGRTLTRTEWDRYLPGTDYDPVCSAPRRLRGR